MAQWCNSHAPALVSCFARASQSASRFFTNWYTFIKLPREVRSCSSMAAHMLSSDVYVHELLVTWQPPQTKDTEL
jgi:hypothetical protein